MTLTVYSGDAVELKLSKPLTVQSGDALALTLAPGVPTVAIAGASSIAFVGKGLFDASFAVQSTSTTYFEHPYRDFSIAGSSTVAFNTWLRTFAVDATSTPLFRPGFRFAMAGATIPSLNLADIKAATVAIPGASELIGAARAEVNAAFAVKNSATKTAFAGGRNYDSAMVVFGKSDVRWKWLSTNDAAFSAVAKSTAAFSRVLTRQSSTSFSGASSVAFYGEKVLPAGFNALAKSTAAFARVVSAPSAAEFSGASSVAFYGEKVLPAGFDVPASGDFIPRATGVIRGAFNSGSVTASSFYSSFYTGVVLPPIEFDDVVFSRTKHQPVYAAAR